MVEQASVRRASDAEQQGNTGNPLHSGISSRTCLTSRELHDRNRATHPWMRREFMWAHWDSVVTASQIGNPLRRTLANMPC